MPGQFLTHAERDRLSHFPKEISNNDLITYFTLSPADLYQIPPKSASHNRLGFALQLCTLRFLGFSPDEITQTPISVVAYIANQLNVDPTQLNHYGKREHTRTDHLQKIQRYLGITQQKSKIRHRITQDFDL
jgi:TnpA family transposase